MSVQVLRESVQRFCQAERDAIATCNHNPKPCKECISKHLNLLRPEAQFGIPKKDAAA